MNGGCESGGAKTISNTEWTGFTYMQLRDYGGILCLEHNMTVIIMKMCVNNQLSGGAVA